MWINKFGGVVYNSYICVFDAITALYNYYMGDTYKTGLWNNKITSFNLEGRLIINQDNTLICVCDTKDKADYIIELNNAGKYDIHRNTEKP